MKKFAYALVCFAFSIITLLGLCSCNRSFKYDWTKVDAFMEENGADYPAVKVINGSTFLDRGKALIISDDKNEDTRITVQLIKLDKYRTHEYYLESKIEYFTQIPDTTFYIDIFWHLPYNKADEFDRSYCGGEITSYNPKILNPESLNDNDNDTYELFVKHAKRTIALMSELKIDKEGQFESCKYDYQKIRHTLSINNGYFDEPVLDKPYEEYLNDTIAVGIAKTTEFFNENKLPLFYEFADIMVAWEIYDADN